MHAERTFKTRQNFNEKDTNPLIVQMYHMGKLIDHWYYRSDQWVDQPYFKPSAFLQPYVGPAHLAIGLYGKRSYEIDEEMTNYMLSKYCK